MSEQNKKQCIICLNILNHNRFYRSYNKNHPDGYMPVCKKCLFERVDDKNLTTVKDALRLVDRPFIYDIWLSSMNESKNNVFGTYIKNLQMHQNRVLTWEDSIFEYEALQNIHDEIVDDDIVSVTNIEDEDSHRGFTVTRDIIVKFGKGYTSDEYFQMEKFYQDMTAARDISTPEHKKLLIYMCKIQLEMDKALTNKDVTTFEKLHRQYQELIKNSGFRPIDKTASDVSSGVRTFSQIFSEVEKDGYIKPVSIEENQDIVDKTIQYILNYQLKLLNMQVLTSPPEDTPRVDDNDG